MFRKASQILRKNKKHAMNLSWSVVGKIIRIVKEVFTGVLLARILGPEDFGTYSYVISFTTLFSVLAEFRVRSILIRELSKKNADANTLLGSSLFICLFFSLVIIGLLSFSVGKFVQEEMIQKLIVIYSLNFLFQSFRVLRSFFVAQLKNSHIVKSEIICTVLTVVTYCALIVFNFSLKWFIVAATVDFLFLSIGYVFFYWKYYNSILKWKVKLGVSYYIAKSSFPLVLSGMAAIIYQRIDEVMIKEFLEVEQVGYYSVAMRLAGLVIFVPMVLIETLIPTLVKIRESSYEKYHKVRQLFSDTMVWGSIVLSICVFLTAKIIILILYGDEYKSSIDVLRILSFKGVLVSLGAVAGNFMIIENVHKYVPVKNIVGCIINICLNLLLIPLIGIKGAAITTLVSYGIASYLIHFFMPVYRGIFIIQTKSLFIGLFNIYTELKQRL